MKIWTGYDTISNESVLLVFTWQFHKKISFAVFSWYPRVQNKYCMIKLSLAFWIMLEDESEIKRNNFQNSLILMIWKNKFSKKKKKKNVQPSNKILPSVCFSKAKILTTKELYFHKKKTTFNRWSYCYIQYARSSLKWNCFELFQMILHCGDFTRIH